MRVSLVVLAIFSLQAAFAEPRDIQTFYLSLLLKGPTWTADVTPDVEKIQREHAAYLAKLGAAGQATISGPFGDEDDGDVRGLVILKAGSMDEARALAAGDPAVAAGRLKTEILAFAVPGNWFAFGPLKDDQATRQFVFGFLKSGPSSSSPATPEELATLQAGHLTHLWTLRESGALVMGGPLVSPDARRGVVVLAVDGINQAREFAESDPMVRSGRFIVELHPWYAVDGVMKIVK